MENEFEKYLEQHRGAFEKGGPSPEVWQKLQGRLEQHHKSKAKIIRMKRVRWSIAASVLVCIGVALIVFKRTVPVNPMASIDTAASKPMQPSTAPNNNTDAAGIKKAIPQKTKERDNELAVTSAETRQTLFYYSKLIDIRQQQIHRLQSIDPDLYKQSQKAINDLNTVYSQLRDQLSGSINQEKVLESMIENLQMQEKILSNQLQIIKELESKSNNNGKEVKEI
jgi:TolA-binding protein